MRKPDPTKTVLTNAVKVLTEQDRQMRHAALEFASRRSVNTASMLEDAEKFYAFLTGAK